MDKEQNRVIKFRGYNRIVGRAQYFTLQDIEKQKGAIQWQNLDISQFTGFHLNGQEIYEGDLIRLGDKYTYEVRFEDGKFVCYHTNKEFGKWGDLCRLFDPDFREYNVEVIGSIYSTPNLIKK